MLNSFHASKDDVKLFEVDNRGTSLFVELVYPNNIADNASIYSNESKFTLENFKSYIAFVAIKNGEHQSKGFAYFSSGISSFAPPSGNHVSMIHDSVLDFFKIKVND